MRRPVWILIVAACHAPPRRPEVAAAPCDAGRIGRVAVSGAPPSVVPGLAVLEGTHDDRARTQRIVDATLEALHWRGYARARLDVTRATGCHTELRVAVALGPRFRIANIAFDTDDAFPETERLAAIEDALGTVNTVGGVHIDYRLRRALESLETRYHDAGWLDAHVGAPTALYDDAGRIDLSIKVAAGKRYRIGVIRALGANPETREAVLDELGVEAGGWYDGQALRRGIERARRRVSRPVELRTRDADDGVIEVEAVLGASR